MVELPDAAPTRGEFLALSAAIATVIAEHPRAAEVMTRLDQVQANWAGQTSGGRYGEATALLRLLRSVEAERSRAL